MLNYWQQSQIDTAHKEKDAGKEEATQVQFVENVSTLYIIWVAHKGDRPQSVTLKAFKLFGLKIQLQKGKKKKRKRRIEPISPSVSSRRTNQTDQIPSLERKSVVKEEGSK